MNIMIAGGGTGGHISPGIAIAEALERLEPGVGVFFVGRKASIEERVVGRTGRDFVSVPSAGLRRRADLRNLAMPFIVAAGYAKALGVVASRRPSVAVGTGGFVSLPPVAAARTLGVPVVLQEQNSYPGLATRLLSRFAESVHITFEETRSYLPRAKNVTVSGNPVRGALSAIDASEARARLGLSAGVPVVFFVGGSKGAHRINTAVTESMGALSDLGAELIIQTGSEDEEMVKRAAERVGAKAVVKAFFDDIAPAYAASDLIVSRAGATAISEIALVGRAAVLVPYPYATEDHQTKNALALQREGAAIVVPDAELTAERLVNTVTELLRDGTRLAPMAQSARRFARPDAAERVARAILETAGSRGRERVQ